MEVLKYSVKDMSQAMSQRYNENTKSSNLKENQLGILKIFP